MRIFLSILAIVFGIIAIGLAVNYNYRADKAQKALDDERYGRLLAEENLQKTSVQIKSLESELDRDKNKIKSIDAMLQQTKSTNSELTERLKEVDSHNQALNIKLQELQKMVDEYKNQNTLTGQQQM